MTNEDNDKAQLMRNKARENAAFYYPKTIEGLEAKVRELEAQLAQWQVEAERLMKALKICSVIGMDAKCFKLFGLVSEAPRLQEVRKVAETALQGGDLYPKLKVEDL